MTDKYRVAFDDPFDPDSCREKTFEADSETEAIIQAKLDWARIKAEIEQECDGQKIPDTPIFSVEKL